MRNHCAKFPAYKRLAAEQHAIDCGHYEQLNHDRSYQCLTLGRLDANLAELGERTCGMRTRAVMFNPGLKGKHENQQAQHFGAVLLKLAAVFPKSQRGHVPEKFNNLPNTIIRTAGLYRNLAFRSSSAWSSDATTDAILTIIMRIRQELKPVPVANR